MASSSSSPVTGLDFLSAALNGDLNLLKSMVAKLDDGSEENFAKIRGFDSEGFTLLHVLAVAGKTYIFQYLIEALKFDVNDQDRLGATPLHYAVGAKHLQNALYLLENGASVDITTNCGFTPLHLAAAVGPLIPGDGKDILQLLLSRGSDIEVKSDGGTPLTVAAISGNIEAVEFMLQNNANPNPVNSFNNPLYMSSRLSLACTDLLVKGGADPNINFCGETPLHAAVHGSKVEIITFLLSTGANPNTRNYMGLTPLELAASYGDMKAMLILFPVTTKIPSILDWSINGIRKYIKKKVDKGKFNLMKKRAFVMVKSKGEEAFKREEYWNALNWYTRANELDPSDATVWSNGSLCYFRLDRGYKALSEAKECVRLRPDWPKAHFREGEAWKLLKEYKRAAESFSRALKIDPNHQGKAIEGIASMGM